MNQLLATFTLLFLGAFLFLEHGNKIKNERLDNKAAEIVTEKGKGFWMANKAGTEMEKTQDSGIQLKNYESGSGNLNHQPDKETDR